MMWGRKLAFWCALVCAVVLICWKMRSDITLPNESVIVTARNHRDTPRQEAPVADAVVQERPCEETVMAPDFAFDALTDQLVGVRNSAISQSDVAAYVSAFKILPQTDRKACIQRAINLIPDENLTPLIGILIDKETDLATKKLVFNDILKRNDDRKNAVLRIICEDTEHPCSSDARWILKATGEL